MREVELLDQTMNATGPLERIEVFSLEVLDQGPLGRLAIVESSDDSRDPIELKGSGCPKATFARHELVSGDGGADHDRLHEAVLADRLDQSLHRLICESLSRLVRVPGDLRGAQIHEPL
jgi:hypothetical protein